MRFKTVLSITLAAVALAACDEGAADSADTIRRTTQGADISQAGKVNPAQVIRDKEQWLSLSASDVKGLREDMDHYVVAYAAWKNQMDAEWRPPFTAARDKVGEGFAKLVEAQKALNKALIDARNQQGNSTSQTGTSSQGQKVDPVAEARQKRNEARAETLQSMREVQSLMARYASTYREMVGGSVDRLKNYHAIFNPAIDQYPDLKEGSNIAGRIGQSIDEGEVDALANSLAGSNGGGAVSLRQLAPNLAPNMFNLQRDLEKLDQFNLTGFGSNGLLSPKAGRITRLEILKHNSSNLDATGRGPGLTEAKPGSNDGPIELARCERIANNPANAATPCPVSWLPILQAKLNNNKDNPGNDDGMIAFSFPANSVGSDGVNGSALNLVRDVYFAPRVNGGLNPKRMLSQSQYSNGKFVFVHQGGEFAKDEDVDKLRGAPGQAPEINYEGFAFFAAPEDVGVKKFNYTLNLGTNEGSGSAETDYLKITLHDASFSKQKLDDRINGGEPVFGAIGAATFSKKRFVVENPVSNDVVKTPGPKKYKLAVMGEDASHVGGFIEDALDGDIVLVGGRNGAN